jgi:multicomponent Na+:H+ antiporter subunit C
MQASELALMGNILYAGAVGLIAIGLFAVVSFRHIIRILLGLSLVDAGINLFIVAIGFRPGAAAPILTAGQTVGPMVDPIPQALVLTSIVIDVGVLALALALAIRVFRAYKTLDVGKLGERLAQDSEEEARAFPAVGVQPVMRAGPRP